jgi:hypothetical protein
MGLVVLGGGWSLVGLWEGLGDGVCFFFTALGTGGLLCRGFGVQITCKRHGLG